MITIRSPREIETMRKSGKITARTLSRLIEAAKPGVTTGELDRLAEDSIRAMGGVPTFKGYNGYPASICTSVNDQVVHGIPGEYVLREGDVLSIDIGTTFEGYVSDSAATLGIGSISAAAQRLIRVTQECLMLAVAQMRSGNHLGDIGAAVQAHAEHHGYGVVRDLVGHGVGTKMHEEPQVPNYGKVGSGVLLRSGLVLAIEPMITEGTWRVHTLDDGWTVVTEDGKLAAHWEHTVAVTDQGPRILTLRDAYEHEDAARYRPAEEVAA
ncbi:MAG: type I methionyl aminopeptidase [Candidatus Eremiobacteraeota bacterium]|nr:type I methionyl aminopeptidase [Candidatus Eremiobacteraeota bacterium]MBV8354838.1 type I methionyl aminopeptidase [Candidatus Eremiobacteraeota bacterium]